MNVEVLKATSEHVPLLLAGVSSAVSGEVKSLYPDTALHDLFVRAIERAYEADSFFVDGEIIAIVGLTVPNLLSDVAYPWLLPHTENLNKYKFEFLAASKRWTLAQAERWTLQNIVSAKNIAAVRWLKWLGFTVGPIRKIKGEPFRDYKMERK